MRPALRFLTGLLAAFAPLAASAAITVTVSGPGGSASQSLPDSGGAFDLDLPLTRNSLNRITVTARDAQGRQAEKQVEVAQLSLKDVVVASIRAEPLSPQRVEELVNEGVIQLDDPENFNVSVFTIVMVIGGEPIPLVVPLATPVQPEVPTGFETVKMPAGDGGRSTNISETQIVVFDQPVITGEAAVPEIRIPGVLVIEGRIKTLKEFYSVRLLLMNVSGIFTLRDVLATISFPDGGLSSTLPADGLHAFGDILPGDGEVPGQKEREWIVRGDEIGVRRVRIDFGGTLSGPGLEEADPVAFSGAAETDVEVKGPPRFEVRVNHPDFVVENEPYDITVQITNTSDAPALYTSLDLDVAGAGELVDCAIPDPSTVTGCTHLLGPVTRRFGHIFPGQSVLEVFTINPDRSGPITSCLGLSDQNIDLTVSAGVRGCLTGKFPPPSGAPEGIPTVFTSPANNTQSVSVDTPVVAFFSEEMDLSSIISGSSFLVLDGTGRALPGLMFFETLNGRTIAIWQANDTVPGFLADNTEYRIVLTQDIRDRDGNPLFNEYSALFTTTSSVNDTDPPTAALSIAPPVNPNAVVPGQLVRVSLYGSDQGSGLATMELRLQDLDTPGALFQLIDRRHIFRGTDNPAEFVVDSANLNAGHTYLLKGTVYDRKGNVRETTLGLFLGSSAAPPVIVLPADPPAPILRGIALTVKPAAITGSVRRVDYFLNGSSNAVATAFLPPFQTTLGTLGLAETTHTLTAVATDALGQTAQDSLSFGVAANLNEPVVGFVGLDDGVAVVKGSPLPINGFAEDPVGIASVAFYLNSTNGPPLSTGSAPFSLATTHLPAGPHEVLLVARNLAGVANSLANPASVLQFTVFDPPPAPPPPAPTLLSLSSPQLDGEVDLLGQTVAGARVEVRNLDRSFLVTVTANASGQFSARVSAAVGETISAVAYDLVNSPSPSPAATAVVQAPPVLTGITVSPPTPIFTAFGAFADLVVTAQYQNASPANVTAQSVFTTSAPGVASVNAAGRVAANGNGQAQIRVVHQGFTNTVNVTVNVVTLEALLASPPAVNWVAPGEQVVLQVRGVYSNGTTGLVSNATLSLATGDPSVVRVNGAGVLTAVGDGATSITIARAGLPPVTVPVTVNSALDVPPTIAVLSPSDGGLVERGQFVTANLRAQDPTGGVVRIDLALSGALTQDLFQTVAPLSRDVTRGFTFQVPGDAALGGNLHLDARAVDANALSSSVHRVSLVVADLTPPSVSIVAPTNATPFNPGDLIQLTVTADDLGGITELRYFTADAFAVDGSSGVQGPVASTNRTFSIPVPFGVPGSNLVLRAVAIDVGGNATTSAPVQVVLTGADITPPETIATAVSNPGAGVSATVSYTVTDGLADLDHVALYFRRNGIGTFNRYLDPSLNPEGIFQPQSGASGTIVFDTTRTGGDGTYEFFTVGVDQVGNREAAPVTPDQTRAFAAGTVWVTISTPTTIAANDTAFDNQNLRINGVAVTMLGSHAFQNVELVNGAALVSAETTAVEEFGLEIAAWSLHVDATSRLDVNGRGYLGGFAPDVGSQVGLAKPGFGGATYPSGGSHGGLGAVYPGNPLTTQVYGDLLQPQDIGGGGSGGNGGQRGGDGGGRIRLVLTHLMNDGPLRADGLSGSGGFSGSGAGGSIWIEADTLSGTGLVTANGGSGNEAGGGGRVAAVYRDMAFKTVGAFRALAGSSSFGQAGNGTVFLRRAGAGNGSLVVDSAGVVGNFTGLPIAPGTVFENIILRNGARVEVNAPIEVTGRLTLENNAVLRHVAELEAGLSIIATHVDIDASSSINVTGMGYPGSFSGSNAGNPFGLTLGRRNGAGQYQGGSHGGRGGKYSQGVAEDWVYGVPWRPVHLGAGGGTTNSSLRSGNGGGRVDIAASGSVTVHGAIRANGENGLGGFGGSGAGGSIWIRTGLFRGTGVVQANGGGNDEPGGGGRVAVEYTFTEANADFNGFRQVQAFGAEGNFARSSAGTVWLRQGAEGFGHLVVDNNLANPNYSSTPLSPLGFGTVVAASTDTLSLDPAAPAPLPDALAGAWLQPDLLQTTLFEVLSNTTTTLTVRVTGPSLDSVAEPGDRYAFRHRFDEVTVRGGASVLSSDVIAVHDILRLTENALWSHPHATTSFFPYVHLEVGTLSVASNSLVQVTDRGSPGGLFAIPGTWRHGLPGARQYQGGSHAGVGGVYPGYSPYVHTFGDPTRPEDYGGGGGGGNAGLVAASGGGRVRVVAGQVLLDGELRADGGAGRGSFTGSGAGGSIWITSGDFSGSGRITANGGGGDESGGGGRIALDVQTLNFDRDRLEARTSASNFAVGGHGTIYVKTAAQALGDLIVDGGGLVGGTDLTHYPSGYAWDNLTLRRGARVVASNAVEVVGTVALTENATLTHPPAWEPGLQVETDTLTVDATSLIDLRRRGYAGGFAGAQAGNRMGQSKPGYRASEWLSGGSHGGIGGWYNNENPTYGPPGEPYGNPRAPVDLGGGGGAFNGGTPGGYGGGALRLLADQVVVEGALRSDGGPGNGNFTAGGAGGSIWITAQSLTGAGFVSANGGGGDEAGGGGRIALQVEQMDLTLDQVQARSENSTFANGGPGTIYLENTAWPDGRLIIDGHDITHFRERTLYPDLGPVGEVVFRRRAQVTATNTIVALSSLSIQQNSYLTHVEAQESGLRVEAATVNIDATSAINTQGRGYAGGFAGTQVGNRMGQTKPGLRGSEWLSGGSHAGLGGHFQNGNPSYGPPGETYGDFRQPTDHGAGGGAYNSGSTPGGRGGGVIRLVVADTLQVDGTINANGNPGNGGYTAGGAGGSVWINTQTLTGVGTISANGGGGDESGGGGRVAVYAGEIQLTAPQIQASSAFSTFGNGGAGTLYLHTPAFPAGHLIYDARDVSVVGERSFYPVLADTLSALTLRNRAQVSAPVPVETEDFVRLEVNSYLTHPFEQLAGLRVVTDRLEIDASSALDVSGRGYPGGYRGSNTNSTGVAKSPLAGAGQRSGGSHGGLGRAMNGFGPPNAVYGDALQPTDLGAGGGASAGAVNQPAGSGGGAIRVIVQELALEGALRANGQGGAGNYSGSGAGGSIWVTADTITGSGVIRADGVGGDEASGGGRVAVYFVTNTLAAGNITANGSAGTFGGTSDPGTVQLIPVTPGQAEGGHAASTLRIARLETLPGGRMRITCAGGVAGCRVRLEKATSTDATTWIPLGEQTAEGAGVIFEVPLEPGETFLRLRME
jgi:hypothetical protein